MSEREEEISGYASWMVSTLAMIQILKNNNAEGHSQQLTYTFKKCYSVAEQKYGDEFLLAFYELYRCTYPSNENDLSATKSKAVH